MISQYVFVTSVSNEQHIPDIFSTDSRVPSSCEEPASCNVPHITTLFSPERVRQRERELCYVLVGQPRPEGSGRGEDERRGGGSSQKKRRGKQKKGEMGTQHIREYEESKREPSRA